MVTAVGIADTKEEDEEEEEEVFFKCSFVGK
jgi:hypothetical protein